MLELRSLFLDADGVLNNGMTNLGQIKEEYAERLDRIICECRPIHVILCSAWRKHRDLRDTLRARFVIHGQTPTLQRDLPRGDEVRAWLAANPEFSQVRYAIIDDGHDYHSDQPLFRTEHGLTDDVTDAVIAHFRAVA